ncbi:hypothetical protein BAY61_24595 [Prauserella marina]|uniref:Uncharacterized protein n=1 Tax=Prauserella marina TaxID=530584 RepID=A0A222VUS1_9PSEU|nr:hypothetical protein [Prauserella marina]ASR37655.1 hypothetical protein BAY61_24595 [Prauserella marina]PWV75577.1 hypothetical protein DES30_106194 [Prauserella marina]SDD31469.1 hypothetical protein SAMN05421630_107246 [Prauserella marina]
MTSAELSNRAATHVRGRAIGAQIGGVFGAVFVWINSAALTPSIRVPLLVIAGTSLVAVIALSIHSLRRRTASVTTTTGRSPFGWKYWLIVGIEAAALVGGSQVLTALGHPELGIAWVAVVVGTHFFALARVFRLARFHVLGAVITACGLAGFVIRWFGQIEPIAITSGVLTGFVLLAFSLWAFAPMRRPASA